MPGKQNPLKTFPTMQCLMMFPDRLVTVIAWPRDRAENAGVGSEQSRV